ncbi:MAG TPA: cellulase family glycosylhydrolase [Microthrixaceae bacterium]|nr:cellulase family glycosylhydrolase [Microthrixaceae bacterium]
MSSLSRRSPLLLAGVLAIAVLLGACSGSSDDRADPAPTTDRTKSTEPAKPTPLELRPLQVKDQRIVDDKGRQVLLRGANVNALGEYAQNDPASKPTAPVTDEDWDAMAANGFSVVRLIISWSLLEPERGKIDKSYIQEVAKTVQAANDRGIYVVLDAHQDAWSMYSATPEGTSCPAGSEPSVGWDGAPEWATITDGASTCMVTGSNRESAPAVQRAFANFYANTDGIADQLTKVWAAVAEEFADVPGVAGYDLLNEPNPVEPAEANQVAYSQWAQRTIDAIRAAEKKADNAEPKLVFVEPMQSYPLPYNALLPQYLSDPNLVFSSHNYAESIGDILTVEQTFNADQNGANDLNAALWVGEYGFWDTKPETLAVATRYAAEEDRRAVGGAWWGWRQTCGDPHSVNGPGEPATQDQVHLITRGCSADAGAARDTDIRYTDEFLRILGRAFPRAAPGHITELVSDPASGKLQVAGADAPGGSELVVWLPTVDGDSNLKLTRNDGLKDVKLTSVDGGRILTASSTGGDWSLAVG